MGFPYPSLKYVSLTYRFLYLFRPAAYVLSLPAVYGGNICSLGPEYNAVIGNPGIIDFLYSPAVSSHKQSQILPLFFHITVKLFIFYVYCSSCTSLERLPCQYSFILLISSDILYCIIRLAPVGRSCSSFRRLCVQYGQA